MRGQVKAREGNLGPDLLQQLQRLAPGHRPIRCVVALSGGLDSVTLLHLLVQARARKPGGLQVRAIHVDHHLQEAARRFRAFCRKLARQLDVPLEICDVQVRVPRGGSMEEHARLARYEALRGQVLPGELLLTAQHADDQLETVLIALLRGAGPKGLAAMPADMPFGAGRLVRPMLGISRARIARHAAAAGLTWIEDPSNLAQRFDRNYLRTEVVPRLRARWPAVADTVARSARHCGDAAAQLESAALRDVEVASDGPDLEVAVLRRWNRNRQKAALRAWIARHGIRLPDERRIEQVLNLLDARPDANPFLDWPGARLRRHAGRLVLATAGPPPAPVDAAFAVDWDWRRSLVVPGGRLVIRRGAHGDLDLDRLPKRLRVVRMGREPGGPRLRKLLQELQVPEWERGRLLLMYEAGNRANRVLAVSDLWLDESVRSDHATRRRGRIVWRDTR